MSEPADFMMRPETSAVSSPQLSRPFGRLATPKAKTGAGGDPYTAIWPEMPSSKYKSHSTRTLPVTQKETSDPMERFSKPAAVRPPTPFHNSVSSRIRPPTPNTNAVPPRARSRTPNSGHGFSSPLVSRSAPDSFWGSLSDDRHQTDDFSLSKPLVPRSASSFSSASVLSNAASTMKGKKTAHFISGSNIMNGKSGSSVFQGKLVRMKSLKTYREIFKGMKIDKDGTVPIDEFERHISQTAPMLLPHAQALYHSICKKSSSKQTTSHGLDFQALLSALFPAATSADIHELLQMIDKPDLPPKGPTKREKADARDIFEFWNTSNTGRLTYEECDEGMAGMSMPAEEMENSLYELFGEIGQPGFNRDVGLSEFTAWFTGTAGL